MAQEVLYQTPYEKEWQEIDSLMQNGLPRSAKEEILSLRLMAKKNNQVAHDIKALLYLVQVKTELEERGEWGSILQLEKELSKAGQVQKPIIASLLAEQYYHYYQRNSWQLRNRTQTNNAPTEDETTWTMGDFLQRITDLYLSSLQSGESKNIKLADFGPLVVKGVNRDKSYTVLYELLLDRAIYHFSNHDAFLNAPSYESVFDTIGLLTAAADFVELDWLQKDKKSSTQLVLEILRDGMQWKQSNYDAQKNQAVLEFDLRRLKIIYEQLQTQDKEEAYQNALDQLLLNYSGTSDGQEEMILLAQMEYWYNRGNRYSAESPGTQHLQWALQKARTIGLKIQSQSPKSLSAQQAVYWQQQIERKNLQISIEAVQLPNENGLVSINYKNINQLHFRVCSITLDDYQSQGDDKEVLNKILAQSAIQNWSEELPFVGDFRNHRTETSFNGLPYGVYSLVVSAASDFSMDEENPMAFIHFWVSELGLLTQFYTNDSPSLLVMNRKTGAPVEGATVHLWETDNRTRLTSEKASFSTDEKGMVDIGKHDRSRLSIEIQKGKDRLFPTETHWVNNHYNQGDNEQKEQAHFFLDRGLYRPGQTLYFKTLVLKNDEHSIPKIVANETFKVALFDANRQRVSELKVTTNAFGSATGSFTLPNGGLLGQMSVQAEIGYNNSQYFRVEEYKRPRFEALIDTLDGQVQLGETVNITGSAMAYAGPAIAEAEVVYNVVRTQFYPWYRWGYPSGGEQVTIASGKTKTDKDGQFEFDFQALPDASLGADHLPTYRFTINVDVVDPSGETRSAEKVITIAKYPLKLEVDLSNEYDLGEAINIVLSSKNLDGKPVEVLGEIAIDRLDMPKQDWVKRYWPVPDQPLMNARLFKERFPHFLYDDESVANTRKSLETIWQKEVSIDGSLALEIDTENWDVGHYKARFGMISETGDTLEVNALFTIDDWKKSKFASGNFLTTSIDKDQLQPGEKVVVDLGSNDQAHNVLAIVSKGDDLKVEQWLMPNDNKSITYEVQEKDRGGLYVDLLSVRHNRFFRTTKRIAVPWSNKELKITYETFRSKLYPGQDEEWTIKIDGPDKDKVAAELLGAMYDASLDQISPFEWSFDVFPTTMNRSVQWSASYFRNLSVHARITAPTDQQKAVQFTYPRLWTLSRYYRNQYMAMHSRMENGMMARSSAPQAKANMAVGGLMYGEEAEEGDVMDSVMVFSDSDDQTSVSGNEQKPPVKIRKDLSETAFFFPQLQTDKEGRVVLRFKAPEALTKWKLQLFAHDKELAFALSEKNTVTQKELMVLPNAPRFMRQGDQLHFATKVSNLSDKTLEGICRLELFDVQTNKSLNQLYGIEIDDLAFKADQGQSDHLTWAINVPKNVTGIIGYRVIATSGDFSDGEEGALPILTNQVLLTESLPLFVRANKKRSFELKHLGEASATAQHQGFALEMTTNPAWMALKALPYLQEYSYNCTEQLVNKYFANALASKLVQDIPKLQAVFEQWKGDPEALKSPLSQNQELKNAVLEETPWVLEAQSEQEQRERIAMLFDLDRLASEQQSTLAKITARQNGNGAFAWFPNGRHSWYITQYVVEQMTHLQTLTGAQKGFGLSEEALNRAVKFCDQESYDHWVELTKDGIKEDRNYLSPIVAHYIYVRSHHLDVVMNDTHRKAYDFWWAEAEAHILKAGLQTQALITIAAQKAGRTDIAQRIFASLRERALHSQELGMYWKYDRGYYWHQLPVETHTLLMEAFEIMGAEVEEVEEMKIWLLRQKETNRWETTKATAAAVYALMTSGNDWLSANGDVTVTFPQWDAKSYDTQLQTAQQSAEAGTGYYKVSWPADEVNSKMATVDLKNKSKAPAWGGVYWQYFEDIDKADAFEEGPLKIERTIFKNAATDDGKLLVELSDSPTLGDRLTVRLTIRTDRDMEFVHLKDLRASGLEPIEQLSQYKYQGGLGYYQTSTDLGTHFFFDRLPKGEHVLEYDLRVFHKGDFSGGLATLQCMYAPKFSSHSEGQRILVE